MAPHRLKSLLGPRVAREVFVFAAGGAVTCGAFLLKEAYQPIIDSVYPALAPEVMIAFIVLSVMANIGLVVWITGSEEFAAWRLKHKFIPVHNFPLCRHNQTGEEVCAACLSHGLVSRMRMQHDPKHGPHLACIMPECENRCPNPGDALLKGGTLEESFLKGRPAPKP